MQRVEPSILFRDLLKITTRHRKLLCLNVATAFVGLAYSKHDDTHASSLIHLISNTEHAKNGIELLASEFRLWATRFCAEGFVVAYPFYCQHEATHIEVLMDKLSTMKALEGMKYTYWNKRFSEKKFEAALVERLHYRPVDCDVLLYRLNAVSTLQDYLFTMDEEHEAERKEENE